MKKKTKKPPHGDGYKRPDPAVAVDGAKVKLGQNPDGTLRLITPGKTWRRVRIRLGRPLFHPDDFATVLSVPEGGGWRKHAHMSGGVLEYALITNLPGLSPEAKKILEDHRESHDLTCRILSVKSLTHQFGAAFWDVETDKGHRQFVIRGTTEHVRWLTDDRLLITDVQGNRFEIPSLNGLDRWSQNQIALIL
jgi:hypothetical protein